jgi:AmmeMemoRadiSam system protein A
MEPMSSAEAAARHARDRTLLAVARASIEHGLRCGVPLEVDPSAFAPELREPRATFVTLRADGALRGCIGSLEAHRPLVADVAHNAFAAANRDPRFSPLHPSECPRVELHVSILSPPEPIRFRTEQELLDALEPRVHGLWISAGSRRATFLPQVWEQLPNPREFLRRLLEKAGIAAGFPAARLQASRYTVEEIAGPLEDPNTEVTAHR